ncbi:hypothetical protein QJS04_geneDACA021364 [Acorus gramineus]|uniref:F-box domain-containing protein n=1 Tax=Acorus gramineus TaxID=55184 RepID=A0AAV9AM87_ACOGR|nr:hypothetical protein QJS04_geneDACA021364 [Acorus gramineus]
MEVARWPPPPDSAAVGLHLLPTELLHDILSRLPPSDLLLLLRSVSLSVFSPFAASPDFLRLHDSLHSSSAWLFLLHKHWPSHFSLRAVSDRSTHWLRLPLPPLDDPYLLAASGDDFLFSSNSHRELIAYNSSSRAYRRIPISPLGRRGTDSWRRSGLKLVPGPAGSGGFRFIFAELHQNKPTQFEYCSDTDAWRSLEAEEAAEARPIDGLLLNIVNFEHESVLMRVSERPTVLRPRFNNGSVGSDGLHVYGDGWVAVVRSAEVAGEGGRVLKGVDLYGLGSDYREWEMVSSVPKAALLKVGRAFSVMRGCLEEKGGVVRVVLLSDFRGSRDLIWLCYERSRCEWTWIPVPETGQRGSNMAGMSLSSGLGLRSIVGGRKNGI